MEISIAATKTCPHRPILENELKHARLPFKVIYFDEHPELLEKYQLKHSPLLIVDEQVESIGMPGMEKIEELKTRNVDLSQIRIPKRDNNHMIPNRVKAEPGLVEVDTTWGSIQPMQVAHGVLTVEELKVHYHQKMNLPIIDARKPDTNDAISIVGSKNIPFDEVVKRIDEIDKNHPSIFFCNGPQCPQSSTAIKNLLKAGYPADKILYYRGGMHDWITLGLPVEEISV
jgi:rhodanese-related sulfurtransferase/glutaredoxin